MISTESVQALIKKWRQKAWHAKRVSIWRHTDLEECANELEIALHDKSVRAPELTKLASALIRLEWRAGFYVIFECPVCQALEHGGKHTADCALDAALTTLGFTPADRIRERAAVRPIARAGDGDDGWRPKKARV